MKIKNKRLIEIVQSAFSWIKIQEHNLFRLMIFSGKHMKDMNNLMCLHTAMLDLCIEIGERH